ncbi:GDSL esterase/lipase At1g28590-like [Tasmannia lanceolata]|uniref:GDSL esterase/lipase At1g28590-like n=1 Tax=Tasmannia lanceolata TaxID=3420 RepID=UPI004064A991
MAFPFLSFPHFLSIFPLFLTIFLLRFPNIDSKLDCYTSIFSFGDSLIDTGNFLYSHPHDYIGHLPYGETYFHHPTGRCSDGRVILDLLAEEFGIPLLPAYLVSRSKEQDFRGGANFAVAGGTALDAAFFAERGIEDLSTNYSMGVQLNWFMELLPTLCPDSSNCRDMLRRSLFLMGEFGGNDYSLVYQKGWITPELHTVVSQIITAISSAVDMLIEHGATTVMVPGTLPIGCFLTIFGRPSKDNYEPLTGCRKDLNELVSYHNQQLQKELDWMRDKHPNATIIYVDYYNAALPVFGSPYQFGFSKGAFVACCGGGGPYNFNSSAPCGSPWAKAFNNTSLYWNWDGRHPTEAGNRMITTGLIEGPYTIPPITSSCPSLASENVNHPHYE